MWRIEYVHWSFEMGIVSCVGVIWVLPRLDSHICDNFVPVQSFIFIYMMYDHQHTIHNIKYTIASSQSLPVVSWQTVPVVIVKIVSVVCTYIVKVMPLF